MEILNKIKERLPAFFNKGNNTLLETVLGGVANELEHTKTLTKQAVDSLILQNSKGVFLDYWSSWYGIKRLQGEDDTTFALRILAEITIPKQTIPGIRQYLSKITKIPISDISIYEPFNNLFFLSGNGTLSGKQRLTDSKYWNWTVIDININKKITNYIRELGKFIKAGGVKVFWTQTLGITPQILSFVPALENNLQLNIENFYSAFVDVNRPYFILSEQGNLSDIGAISGRKQLTIDYYRRVWSVSFATIIPTIYTQYFTLSNTGTLSGDNPLSEKATILLNIEKYYTNHLYQYLKYKDLNILKQYINQGYGTQPYGMSYYGSEIDYTYISDVYNLYFYLSDTAFLSQKGSLSGVTTDSTPEYQTQEYFTTPFILGLNSELSTRTYQYRVGVHSIGWFRANFNLSGLHSPSYEIGLSETTTLSGRKVLYSTFAQESI